MSLFRQLCVVERYLNFTDLYGWLSLTDTKVKSSSASANALVSSWMASSTVYGMFAADHTLACTHIGKSLLLQTIFLLFTSWDLLEKFSTLKSLERSRIFEVYGRKVGCLSMILEGRIISVCVCALSLMMLLALLLRRRIFCQLDEIVHWLHRRSRWKSSLEAYCPEYICALLLSIFDNFLKLQHVKRSWVTPPRPVENGDALEIQYFFTWL